MTRKPFPTSRDLHNIVQEALAQPVKGHRMSDQPIDPTPVEDVTVTDPAATTTTDPAPAPAPKPSTGPQPGGYWGGI